MRRKAVVSIITRHLPAMHVSAEWVEAGGLMSYGVSLNDLFRGQPLMSTKF